jgi:hypothetical protein
MFVRVFTSVDCMSVVLRLKCVGRLWQVFRLNLLAVGCRAYEFQVRLSWTTHDALLADG